jgi:hypothetical protein
LYHSPPLLIIYFTKANDAEIKKINSMHRTTFTVAFDTFMQFPPLCIYYSLVQYDRISGKKVPFI